MWPLGKKKALVDILKDLKMRKMRPLWTIWVAPKSNAKCPYQRHIEEGHTEKRGPQEDGVVRPQAIQGSEPPEAGRPKKALPVRLHRERGPADPWV